MQAPATEAKEETTQTRHPHQGFPTLHGRLAARGLERAAGRLSGVLRGLFFLLGLVVITHALVYVSDTLAADSNTRFLQVDREHIGKILANAGQINALALGNSHTGALQMADLGFENGYRFARADGDIFEVDYFMRYLAPRLPRLEVALIPISYFSFQTENTSSSEVEIRRVHMYASLPAWKFLPGDLEPFLIGKSHTYVPIPRLIREDNWKGVFQALLGRPPETKSFIEVEAGDCSSLNKDQLAASAENRVAKYMRLSQEMNSSHPNLPQDANAALAEMTRYLQGRGVRVIFFTPPYWQGYSEQYMAQDPQTVLRMRSSMQRLQQEVGVEYYDFAEDPNFVGRQELFKDSDHLNSCGAALFSRQLELVIDQRQAVHP